MTPLRGNRLTTVVVLGLCAGVGLLVIGALAGARVTRDCSFSRETWAAGRAPLRFEVLEHDLGLAVDCGTLQGASSDEVRRLLGEPDARSPSVWTYDVGVPDMLSDYPDLELRFGSGGRVTDSRVPGYIE
jgi:hypothetical protein